MRGVRLIAGRLYRGNVRENAVELFSDVLPGVVPFLILRHACGEYVVNGLVRFCKFVPGSMTSIPVVKSRVQTIAIFFPSKGMSKRCCRWRNSWRADDFALADRFTHPPVTSPDSERLICFGGKSTYIDNSSSTAENTTIDISLKVALGNIIEQIEKSGATPEEKADAKSRLKGFLKHPLVIAIAGAAVKPLLESL